MKTLLISVIVICVLFLVSIYVFIPSEIAFSKVIIIKTKVSIANRFLMDESKWGRWFPTDPPDNLHVPADKKSYQRKGYSYSITKTMMDAAGVAISNGETRLQSLITIISINSDSVAIEWKSDIPGGRNPVTRLQNYFTARKLQRNMADILATLKSFLGKDENIYGIRLHVIMSKDSTLVATERVTRNYPSTADIYDLIGTLKKYVISQQARENNFPMLHVKKVNDTTFETLVAIPVNKSLEGNDKIFFKRFVPWKVLAAEVKGGTYTVNEALDQMAIYRSDYQIQAMAIPFASLVTDRSMQPDTLKWITGIYTPVP